MNISLYGTRFQDRSGKIRWLLEEMGLTYDNQWLDFSKKEHESDSYLKINPMGRIPAVKIEGRALCDSAAICAYVADLHLDKKLAPPLTASERLEYQQWLYFASSTIDAFVTRIMIIEDLPLGELFDKKSDELLTEVRDAYSLLDKTLSQQNFLIKQFSVADICVGFHLNICNLWPEFENIFNEFSNLKPYLTRLQARPAAVKAKVFLEEEG